MLSTAHPAQQQIGQGTQKKDVNMQSLCHSLCIGSSGFYSKVEVQKHFILTTLQQGGLGREVHGWKRV